MPPLRRPHVRLQWALSRLPGMAEVRGRVVSCVFLWLARDDAKYQHGCQAGGPRAATGLVRVKPSRCHGQSVTRRAAGADALFAVGGARRTPSVARAAATRIGSRIGPARGCARPGSLRVTPAYCRSRGMRKAGNSGVDSIEENATWTLTGIYGVVIYST